MADDAWPLCPRRWFETDRRARRRFEQAFAERCDVWTMPDGQRVATVRAQWRGSKNSEELWDLR